MTADKNPAETLTYKDESFYYASEIQNTVRMRERILKSNVGKKVAFVHGQDSIVYVYVSKLRYPDRITTMHPINITLGD